MQDQETASASPTLVHRRLLPWAAALWAVVALFIGVWADHEQVQAHRLEVQAAASRRLDAALQNVDSTFSQLQAFGRLVAQQSGLTEFLLNAVPTPPDSTPSRAGMRDALLQTPAVLATSQTLDALARDLQITQIALANPDGLVLADSAYRDATEGLLSGNLSDQPVFRQALQSGSGFQHGANSSRQAPGFNIAIRLTSQDRVVGVLLMRVDSAGLMRLSGGTIDNIVLLTDRDGIVVAGGRGSSDLGRQIPLSGRPADTPSAQARPASRLGWTSRNISVAGQAAPIVDIDAQSYMALSSPLPRHPYTAWILAPLQDEDDIHALVAAAVLATVLSGWLVMGLGFQHLERSHIARQARRATLDTMRSLPLTVYRYEVSPETPGRFLHIGPGAQALLGIDENLLRQQPVWLWQRLGQDKTKPPLEESVFEVDTPQGRHWIRTQAHVHTDADGHEIFDGYLQDITAERRVGQRFQAIYEVAPVGILFFHRDEGITRCNAATLTLFGASSQESLKGRHPWRAPLSPSHQSSDRHSETLARQLLDQQMASPLPVQLEWRHLRLDGSRFDASVVLLSLHHESPGLFMAIIDDITARKQSEEAIRLASEAASANARAKTAFLSNMSHEIRTPMNAVIGMTHLALTDPHSEKTRAYVAKAHQAAKSLLQIINDILDLSRIEAGQIELECIEFSLQGVIDQLADVLGLQAEQKGLELLFTAPPDLPTHLLGDPMRLRQILLNLGSNAIKFTEQGSVTLGLEVQSRRGYEVVLHGWVRDTGIGLDRDQQALLFTPLRQVDASATRRFGGGGLGLSICRQLLERMGGQLWVESTPGQGATFHFTMKTDLPSGQAGQAVLLHDWTGKRALLADDNADAREVLGKMLSSLGVEVHSVANGDQALEALSKTDRPYDWVLLDWKMPQMDGVQCAQLIDRRVQQLFPQTHPCILLVTAFNREDALEAAAGVPLADILTKPVTPATLFESLKRTYVVKTLVSHATEDEEAPVSPDLLAGTRILLVEDQPLNQELARDLMELAGATVVCADNGAQALTALAREGPFDCVLMDCQMPVMDGYTATLKIRSQPQWQQLPIIAMTASALATDREHALNSGMNDHIAKPLDVRQTYEVVSKWISASQALQRDARIGSDNTLKKDPDSET